MADSSAIVGVQMPGGVGTGRFPTPEPEQLRGRPAAPPALSPRAPLLGPPLLTSWRWTRLRQESEQTLNLVIAQEEIHRIFSVLAQGRLS